MKILLAVLACLLFSVPALAQMSDLIISEYIEGSSYNKSLEIYNGTDDPISLAGYSIELYANGSTSPTTVTLSGSVAGGDVFVLSNPSAVAAVLAVTDQTSGALTFNGNDAIVLRGPSGVVDRFGQVGDDPGSGWTCYNGSTYNSTLRRAAGVCDGDTQYDAPFDPCDEWEFYPSDSFDDLGHHTDDCHSVMNDSPTWGSLKAVFR